MGEGWVGEGECGKEEKRGELVWERNAGKNGRMRKGRRGWGGCSNKGMSTRVRRKKEGAMKEGGRKGQEERRHH